MNGGIRNYESFTPSYRGQMLLHHTKKTLISVNLKSFMSMTHKSDTNLGQNLESHFVFKKKKLRPESNQKVT